MKQIWNTFCEDISKNKGVKEITFEKEIVKGFLQALGWSRYDRNLEEQYGLYNRKWIPDFVFYLNNDKNAKEIILELKKPDHKQRKVDIEQIEAYMKLTDCRFGLYFGEKMEDAEFTNDMQSLLRPGIMFKASDAYPLIYETFIDRMEGKRE